MVYIILGQGFEEIEATAPGDILRRGGVEVRYAAAGSSLSVPGSVGITLQADVLARDIAPKRGDTVVIPGGMGGVNTLKHDDAVMAMIAKAAENGAELAAICAGPSVLAKLGLLDGKNITCYPGCEKLMGKAVCHCDQSTMLDGTLVTGRAPGAALDFGYALLAHLRGERASEDVREGMCYRV